MSDNGNVQVYWNRDDIYRIGSQCCYVTVCGKADGKACERDPEKCEIWDALFDGECLADEVLSK